jgi:GntR family transcriptional regulator
MLFSVDPAASTPLAAQIAAQVRGAIARGEVESGQRLPPARDLADALNVNMHTVLRAYAELRDDGLIELRRGRGAVVLAGIDADHVRLREMAREFVAAARRLGLRHADMAAILKEVRP